MRDLHSRMLAALLAGEGMGAIAELAAEEAGTPVAIVVPGRSLAAASSAEVELEPLLRAAAARLHSGEPAPAHPAIEAEAAIEADGEPIGFAVALAAARNGMPEVLVDRKEVVRTTALAALAELAVADARDEVAANVRGSLLEELRDRSADPALTVARAARLGCDLAHGAVALVAEIRPARPNHAAVLIRAEHPGAIAEPLGARVYALLPARAGDRPERALAASQALARRLQPHGPAAFSSFCADPAELDRAIAEAELMLDVISHDDSLADHLAAEISNGVYRLLFRAMATDPDEVQRFYEETVEPLVAHDTRYRTDLLGTLESYLANDCNMNATARAVFAHRHTVAHRLGRVRELTGLDPSLGDDRERLGLGLKVHRIVAPTLPR